MTEILTAEGLAYRWHCSVGRIRNTPSDQLPPALRMPGSRLVRFRLCDVIAWEAAHVAGKPSDPRDEPPTPSPARKRRPGRPRKTRGNR